MDFGTDHQRGLGLAGGEQRIGEVEAVEESAALLADAVCRNVPAGSHAVLHQRSRPRRIEVRRHRRHDQRVDIFRRQAGVGNCGEPGLNGEVRGRHAGRSNATFGDTGAALDPLVVRVHDRLEVFVGDDLIGQGDAGTGDDASHGPYTLGVDDALVSARRRVEISQPVGEVASLGSPRIRSAMMFDNTWVVPPPMVRAAEKRNPSLHSLDSIPKGPVPARSPSVPANSLASCMTFWP